MKTVTMRVDDSIYDMIKLAADGQRRNLSNFIEFATMQYLTSSQFVGMDEMNEILEDFKKGKYRIGSYRLFYLIEDEKLVRISRMWIHYKIIYLKK